jgi:hypothetical protein
MSDATRYVRFCNLCTEGLLKKTQQRACTSGRCVSRVVPARRCQAKARLLHLANNTGNRRQILALHLGQVGRTWPPKPGKTGVRLLGGLRGCSSMAEPLPSKQMTPVRVRSTVPTECSARCPGAEFFSLQEGSRKGVQVQILLPALMPGWRKWKTRLRKPDQLFLGHCNFEN